MRWLPLWPENYPWPSRGERWAFAAFAGMMLLQLLFSLGTLLAIRVWGVLPPPWLMPVFSSLLISSLRKVIPNEVRLASYILIIATFVTISDLVMQAYFPLLSKTLGAFVPLIVVNCIILGRAEAFAGKVPVKRAVADAFGQGFGFLVALLIMCIVREVIGSGTFLGFPLFGPHYEPWVFMIMPPGGFLTMGLMFLTMGWWGERKKALLIRAVA